MGNSSSSESGGDRDTCQRDAAICSIACVQTNSAPELGYENSLGVDKCIRDECQPDFDRCKSKSNYNDSKSYNDSKTKNNDSKTKDNDSNRDSKEKNNNSKEKK